MSTYVYRYVHRDYPWLYVGKADVDIHTRINAHKKEDKFKPYLKNTDIYYIELSNKAQSKFIETFLIDKYKPLLNVVDKYEEESIFEINLPTNWKPYEKVIKNPEMIMEQKSKLNVKIQKDDFVDLLFHKGNIEYYKNIANQRQVDYDKAMEMVSYYQERYCNLLSQIEKTKKELGWWKQNRYKFWKKQEI